LAPSEASDVKAMTDDAIAAAHNAIWVNFMECVSSAS